MNKYIYINNLGEVREFIDEFNPIFPNIPIEERYAKDFLDNCLIMNENEFNKRDISLGMYYNKEEDSFYYPESPIENETENTEDNNIKETIDQEVLEKKVIE